MIDDSNFNVRVHMINEMTEFIKWNFQYFKTSLKCSKNEMLRIVKVIYHYTHVKKFS